MIFNYANKFMMRVERLLRMIGTISSIISSVSPWAGWVHCVRSHSNSDMLLHPAQREAVLGPGGHTASVAILIATCCSTRLGGQVMLLYGKNRQLLGIMMVLMPLRIGWNEVVGGIRIRLKRLQDDTSRTPASSDYELRVLSVAVGRMGRNTCACVCVCFLREHFDFSELLGTLCP